MGARHHSSIVQHTKKHAVIPSHKNASQVAKVLNYQMNQPTEPRTASGGMFQVGGGTSYPILYPIKEIGTIGSSAYTINLADQNLHCQKMKLNPSGTGFIFSFDGLTLGRAITFMLDITLSKDLTSISWPATLFQVPNLPLFNGARFFLFIVGFRDNPTGSSEEDIYYVVNSNILNNNVVQTVTGSRSGGTALRNLLSALNNAGIIVDASTT